MSYKNLNQWNVYNFKTKRIHLLKNVRFNEKSSYYELDSTFSKCLKEKEEEDEVEEDEIWTKKKNQQMNLFFC